MARPAREQADHAELAWLIAGQSHNAPRAAADVLIARFGGLAATLFAPSQDIDELSLPRELRDFIVRLGEIFRRALAPFPHDRISLTNIGELVPYLRTAMAFRTIEQFRVLFLDAQSCLIADEILSQGTVDQTALYPREVVKRALQLGAVSLILVHNHPSGQLQPSTQDIKMTQDLVRAGKALGIRVADHLIICRQGHASMRERGML